MVTRGPVDREMENVPLLHLADVSGTLGPGHVIFHSYYGRLNTGSPGSRQLCANIIYYRVLSLEPLRYPTIAIFRIIYLV